MQNAKYNFNSLFIPRGKKVLGAKMNAYIYSPFFFFLVLPLAVCPITDTDMSLVEL